jgi:alpha-beta hydrolase superfamily lysophospholipase
MTERTRMFFDSGGVTCAAYLYHPTEAKGLMPCVVMGHGASGTMDSLFPLAEQFASAGMTVLVFDYRYFGASGGQPRQLMDTRQQREDWHAAIRFARNCKGIDPERIALWGTSFSGGHVIAVAATDQRIAAVVSQVPLIDAWRGGPGVRRPMREVLKIFVAAFRDAIRGLLGRPPYLIPVFGSPGEAAQFTDPKLKPFFDALQRESSTWRNEFTPRLVLAAPRYRSGTAQRLKMPLLVCIADDDVNASPSFAAYVAKQAPRGEVKSYPVGHFDVYHEINREVFEQVIADQITFLRTHLLAPSIDEPSLGPKEHIAG